MDSPGVTERLLRRDRMVLMVLIGFLFGLAGFGEKLAKVGGALLFAWGVYALIGAI